MNFSVGFSLVLVLSCFLMKYFIVLMLWLVVCLIFFICVVWVGVKLLVRVCRCVVVVVEKGVSLVMFGLLVRVSSYFILIFMWVLIRLYLEKIGCSVLILLV